MTAGRRSDHPVPWERTAWSIRHALARQVALALDRLLRWHDLARQRRELLALDERMLKDIGITRAEAEREADRPFWDPAAERWRDWR